MKERNIISQLFVLATIFTFLSCNNGFITLNSQEEIREDEKELSNAERSLLKEDKKFFRYSYQEQKHSEYAGNIVTDSSFIQFDSVRVYFSNNEITHFKNIFSSGLISGQMIYCEMDSSCEPPILPGMHISKEVMAMQEKLMAWNGDVISIYHVEELHHIKRKPYQRRFRFHCYPNKFKHLGGDRVFYLELTNDKADNKTDLEFFIEGAKVTFLKNNGSLLYYSSL